MKKLESVLFVAIAAALGGCSLAPAYQPPATPPAQTYSDLGPWVAAQPSDQSSRDNWWHFYSEAELDALQTKLLANNADLAAALAHYQQAQAYSMQARSGLFPQIEIGRASCRERV